MGSLHIPPLKPAFSALLALGETFSKANKVGEYRIILDAYRELGEMQRENYALADKLREVEEELKRLREDQASAVGRVRWVNHLWLYNDDSPCCLFCWEKQKRLFHVVPSPERGDYWDTQCPECGTKVEHVPKKSYWQMERQENQESRELHAELEAARARELREAEEG